MIKVVLFDADGVLIHTEMFSRQLERDYGILSEKLDPFFATDFQRCLTGELDLKEAITSLLPEWGWQGTVDEFLEYWFSVEHKIDERLIAYAQNLRSKGIRCFVATNQEAYRAKYMLEKMGFSESFDGMYASAHLGEKKPSIDFFKHIFSNFDDLEKSEVIFWDDKQLAVDAAREFGFHAEVYTDYDDFIQKMDVYLKEGTNYV